MEKPTKEWSDPKVRVKRRTTLERVGRHDVRHSEILVGSPSRIRVG